MQVRNSWRVPRIPTALIVLAFAVGAVLLTIAPTTASTGTSIHVDSASVQVGQTTSTNVSVTLAASDAIQGFDVTLSYDPSVVSVATATMLGGWTQLATCQNHVPSNCAAGTVHVAGFQLNSCAGPTCALFSVSWNGIANGQSPVQVTAQQLSGTENAQFMSALLNVSAQSGSVSVSGGPTSPSPTSVPTSTPTPTKSPATVATSTPTTAPPTPTQAVPTPTSAPASGGTSGSASPTSIPSPTSAPPPTASATAPVVLSPGDTTGSGSPASDDTPPVPPVAGPDAPGLPATTAVPLDTGAAPGGVLNSNPPTAVGANNGRPSSAATPRPPATGSAGSEYSSTGNALRFLGIALMVLAGLSVASRGVALRPSRRTNAPHRAGLPDADVRGRMVIGDVVDEYLSSVAASAREGGLDLPLGTSEDAGDAQS